MASEEEVVVKAGAGAAPAEADAEVDKADIAKQDGEMQVKKASGKTRRQIEEVQEL